MKTKYEYSPTMKQAILFLSNRSDEFTMDAYNQLLQTVTSTRNIDVYFAYHLHEKEVCPNSIKACSHIFLFTSSILTNLGYGLIADNLLPGNNHIPLLYFFQKYDGYDYYWLVEDDFRFTGKWQYLLDTFTNDSSDFISTHLQYQEEEQNWYWWNSLQAPDSIGKIKKIKSFNPLCRLSKLALHIIDKALRNGWKGHHEVLIPTLCYNQGLTLEDFGGEGLFVSLGNKYRFYDNSTMGIKPVLPNEKNNYFFHPVKQEKQRKNGDLKSNCVFIPVGKNSLHRQLLEGEPEYDLHLMIYDDSYNTFCNDSDFICCQSGFKMDMTYNYLRRHPNLLEQYDYFFLLDDDISITTESVNHFFRIMREYSLKIAQPSLVMSYFTYASTLHNPMCKLRYTNFVEMMMPCFSREALKLVLPTFKKKVKWRGIEHHWPILINTNHKDMAIVDDIVAIHQKPVSSWNKDCQLEYNEYLKQHKLSNEIKIFNTVLNGCDVDDEIRFDNGLNEIKKLINLFYQDFLLNTKRLEVIPVVSFLITSSLILNDRNNIDISMGIMKKFRTIKSMTLQETIFCREIENLERKLTNLSFYNLKILELCNKLNKICELFFLANQVENSKVLLLVRKGMEQVMSMIHPLESSEGSLLT